MRRKKHLLAAVAVIVAAFVALGGPAAAKHWINGADIKPGTVGTKQIANGAITSGKLSKSLRKSLGKTGPRGATGATGPTGPAGQAGARGPAGAVNVLDATGKVLGVFTGFFSGTYYMIFTAQGAMLVYEPSTATDYPIPVAGTALFYRSTDCSGTAYAPYGGSYPLEMGIIPNSTPRPGNPIYVLVAGATQSFTYQSVQSGSLACTTTSGSSGPTLVVRQAGTVPQVQKPFQLVAAG